MINSGLILAGSADRRAAGSAATSGKRPGVQKHAGAFDSFEVLKSSSWKEPLKFTGFIDNNRKSVYNYECFYAVMRTVEAVQK